MFNMVKTIVCLICDIGPYARFVVFSQKQWSIWTEPSIKACVSSLTIANTHNLAGQVRMLFIVMKSSNWPKLGWNSHLLLYWFSYSKSNPLNYPVRDLLYHNNTKIVNRVILFYKKTIELTWNPMCLLL